MNEIKIPGEKIKSIRDSDAICVCNFLYIFKIEKVCIIFAEQRIFLQV